MNSKEIVKLLKVARLLLWNGVGDIDFKTGNCQMYVCIAIIDAGRMLGAPDSVVEELRSYVSTQINDESTATSFLHHSGVADLSSQNVQKFRRSILDGMVDKYEREPKAVRRIKNARSNFWLRFDTLWK